MPYSTSFDDDAKFVSIVFSGQITLRELKAGRSEAQSCLAENKCHRLLVDAKDYRLTHSLGEAYEFTTEHPLFLRSPTRIAVVTYPDSAELFGFVEDVAQNRGTDLKTFEGRRAALDWLLED